MNQRQRIQQRTQIFNKYGGHCAYCGCELNIKDMQVDHINAKYLSEYYGNEVDNSLDNLNPSCRQCNFYKSEYSIDEFRKRIENTLIPNLKKNFDYRLAKKYGLVSEVMEKSIKFYFEGESK